jgi:hypothetical protein
MERGPVHDFWPGPSRSNEQLAVRAQRQRRVARDLPTSGLLGQPLFALTGRTPRQIENGANATYELCRFDP